MELCSTAVWRSDMVVPRSSWTLDLSEDPVWWSLKQKPP